MAYAVADIRLLCIAEEGDAGVSFGRQDVHKGIGVPVQRHAGAGLQQLPVQGGQNPNKIVAACSKQSGWANTEEVVKHGWGGEATAEPFSLPVVDPTMPLVLSTISRNCPITRGTDWMRRTSS